MRHWNDKGRHRDTSLLVFLSCISIGYHEEEGLHWYEPILLLELRKYLKTEYLVLMQQELTLSLSVCKNSILNWLFYTFNKFLNAEAPKTLSLQYYCLGSLMWKVKIATIETEKALQRFSNLLFSKQWKTALLNSPCFMQQETKYWKWKAKQLVCSWELYQWYLPYWEVWLLNPWHPIAV